METGRDRGRGSRRHRRDFVGERRHRVLCCTLARTPKFLKIRERVKEKTGGKNVVEAAGTDDGRRCWGRITPAPLWVMEVLGGCRLGKVAGN
ncbi:hypothetical protein PIB30_055150 [Stylosanthes scabra]|uniref:Uncharacterized protein n=1 Tax=Stylosanthes scabra TaxID=79078 RepID=A0ABU6RJC9_9FABA|nr:hypothetical protein [Stylosanthes scabra]